MEREACVCDHGFERSDLCAEIVIITISHHTLCVLRFITLDDFSPTLLVAFSPIHLITTTG